MSVSQISAVAIVCVLLFLEEAGLPIPVAPGEAALIGAGLLVASGAVPVWLMAPLAYVAVIGGVVTGTHGRIASGLNGSMHWPSGCTRGARTIEPPRGSAPPHQSR